MLLTIDRYWDMIDESDLVFIDDVNAFDEREHLRLLENIDAPMLYATATPNELRSFLMRVGAFNNVVRMRKMPFNVLPTKVHKIEGVWGEPPPEQLSRAADLIRDHLGRGSRIFVIGRTRGDVPRLAQRLEETYDLDVQQLRGDMADTSEQSKRNRRSGVKVSDIGTRVEMMTAFRGRAPSILAATNLIGSGIDIPAADLIVITDSDAFGESETEQLIGRVGRRERPSDAVLVTGTTFEKNPSRAAGGGRGLELHAARDAREPLQLRTPVNFGLHVRTGAGYDESVAYAQRLGCTSLQFFSSSPQDVPGRQDRCAVAGTLHAAAARRPASRPAAIHTSYLINLASEDPKITKGSMGLVDLRSEVRRGRERPVREHPSWDRTANAIATKASRKSSRCSKPRSPTSRRACIW